MTYPRWLRLRMLLVFAVVASVASAHASAYDGIDAGLEAYERHENTRRARIGRQIDVSESAKAGYWYDPWRWYGDPFLNDPWIVHPASPWEYRYEEYAPQPLGHRIIEGPDRGEYRPIYAEDDPIELREIPPRLRALPETVPEELPRWRPRPRRPSGPREF